jgi:RNA polymerase sigma-70 factor, ECF subfamily
VACAAPMVDQAQGRDSPAGPRELDELTLARARRGDPAACTRFVEIYQARVFAALGRMLGPSARGDLVEDLAQETFIRALRALPRFDPSGPARPSTWVLTIATRRALSELRARPSRPVLEEGSWDGVDPGAHGNPERIVARQALHRAIAELTPEQRAAFVLRDVHELSEAEVAEALGLEPAAVRSRVFRARARLRALLADEERGHG